MPTTQECALQQRIGHLNDELNNVKCELKNLQTQHTREAIEMLEDMLGVLRDALDRPYPFPFPKIQLIKIHRTYHQRNLRDSKAFVELFFTGKSHLDVIDNRSQLKR